MTTETEIERLVVRLIGDGVKYQEMLNTAQTETRKAEEELSRASKSAQAAGDQIQNVGRGLTSLGASLLVVGGAISTATLGTARWAYNAFTVQENAEIKLRASLEANGRAVNTLMGDYQKFASDLQGVTKVGDEATLGMLQQAESLGLTGEQAKRAAKNAIGLGSAMGMSAASALRYTALLEQGNATMLTRFLPTLRKIEDPTKRVAEAQRLLANMFNVATAEAQTAEGQYTQAMNALGDFGEQLGAVVAEYLKPFFTSLKETAVWLQGLSPGWKSAIGGALALGAGLGLVMVTMGSMVIIAGQLTMAYAALAASQTAVAITSGLASAGFYALAAVGIALLVDYLSGASKAYAELREQQNQSRESAERLGEARSQLAQKFIQEAQSMPKEEGRKYIDDLIAGYQANSDALEKNLARDKLNLEKMKQSWWAYIGYTNTSVVEDELKQDQQALDDTRQTLDDLKAAAAGANSMGEIVPPETLESAKALEESLNLQKETLYMVGEEVKAYQLKQQGLDEATYEHLLNLAQEVQAEKEAKRAKEEAAAAIERQKKSIDDYITSLQQQVDTMRMTNEEAKIHELQQKGATMAQILQVRALQEQLKVREKEKEAEKEQNALLEEGKRLMEEHLDPLSKFLNRYDELAKMQKAGAISQQVFQDEVKEAEKLFTEAQAKANIQVNFSVFGNEAVRKGSKEFLDLLNNVERDKARIQAEAQAKQLIDNAVAAKQIAEAKQQVIDQVNQNIANKEAGRSASPSSPAQAAADEAERKRKDDEALRNQLLDRIAKATEAAAKREPIEVETAGL